MFSSKMFSLSLCLWWLACIYPGRVLSSIAKLQVFKTCEEEGRQQCLANQIGTIPVTTTDSLSWQGVHVTPAEQGSIRNLRALATSNAPTEGHNWLLKVTDTELLRFLRAKNGNEDKAWQMITKHVAWRNSKYGADSEFTATFFKDSPLHKEVFWMGLNKENCPTLVVRTQIHDGMYYNDDPNVFTSFMVHILEQGKKLYGVGTERPLCVLMDRGGTVFRNGKKKVEKLDMSVMPKLVDLFRHIYHTFTNHYPDVLDYAKAAPLSWFFSMCYRVASSTVLDAKSRARITLIKDSEVPAKLHSVFAPELLPPHLRGTSESYTSTIDVLFDASSVSFPPRKYKLAQDTSITKQ